MTAHATGDGQGFNKFDTDRGQALAREKRWSQRDRTRALKLARKYRKQLPAELWEEVVGASEAGGDEGGQASGPTGDPDDKITPDRLGEAILETEHFAKDRGDRLYHWDNGCYAPTGEVFLKRRVKQLLQSWGAPDQWRSFLAKEVIEYIVADAPLLWDRPPTDVINVSNGLLHIESGKLLPHTPDHLSPVQLPVRFNPRAKCPAWKRFVEDAGPRDRPGGAVGGPRRPHGSRSVPAERHPSSRRRGNGQEHILEGRHCVSEREPRLDR